MDLRNVLTGVSTVGELPATVASLDVANLEYDSRKVTDGTLFFAFSGAKSDGRRFANQAMERGAVAVASDLEPAAEFTGPWIRVEHGRRALGLACRNLFGSQEETIDLTGVTGTNGKTTTTYLIDAVMRRAGRTTAVLGTIGNWVAGEFSEAVNTTPESLDLYRLFARLRAAGGTHVSMEVSSHASELGRVYGLSFHTMVFTNLTQDHLDFHRTMEAYFEAKQKLFHAQGGLAPAWAVINADDSYGTQIRAAPETNILTYGKGPGACVRAEDVETGFDGLKFRLAHKGKSAQLRSPLVGEVNVYNILAACAVGVSYGLDVEMIANAIADCRAVPGRFERVDEGQPFLVVVDYAHTPDALRNAIAVARTLKPKRVITLFGCGGDRDRAKRPLMGMAAAELSDYVVLTSDNPRSEDPLDIINDAMVGLGRFDTPHQAETDRAKAIRIAIQEAGPGDLVLIAGKGHETYQIFSDRTIHFDDREMARSILEEFGYRRKQG